MRYAPVLDRLLPGLGSMLRGGGGNAASPNAPTSGSIGNGAPNDGGSSGVATLGAAALGGQVTELDGQSAVSLRLRFEDGAAFLGPFKIGQVPPLY